MKSFSVLGFLSGLRHVGIPLSQLSLWLSLIINGVNNNEASVITFRAFIRNSPLNTFTPHCGLHGDCYYLIVTPATYGCSTHGPANDGAKLDTIL